VGRVRCHPNQRAMSSVALRVPIPVLCEGIEFDTEILLTGGTVLGQRDGWRKGAVEEGTWEWECATAGRQRGVTEPGSGAEPPYKGLPMCFFQLLRQVSQSSQVALDMDLAALWSHRPLRCFRSVLILAIAAGVPKCMLAVSQPMS
jgi:hypothetical protein